MAGVTLSEVGIPRTPGVEGFWSVRTCDLGEVQLLTHRQKITDSGAEVASTKPKTAAG